MHEAYQLKFDEIHAFSGKTRDEIEDEFILLLAEAYYLGVAETGRMLDKDIEAELDELEDILWLEIEGKTFVDRIDDHLAKEEDVTSLAQDEFGRVYNAAIFQSAKRSGATEKTWLTMLDDRVRATHEYLESVTVGIDDYFYTFDGDKALEPKGFKKAENNAGCRCLLFVR